MDADVPLAMFSSSGRGPAKSYSEIEDLAADPEVEAVDIATRSVDHLEHAKIAINAGKTVFLEKPVTVTHDQALELKEYSETHNVPVYFRHNRRAKRVRVL